MLKTFANTLKIPELRARILFTIGLIAIARLLAMIPMPGVDWTVLAQLRETIAAKSATGGLMSWFDAFSGGALGRCSIGSLSIWPYISAQIIIQLMTAVVPALERLRNEGDAGRKTMTLYTRYLTIAICVFQAFFLAKGVLNPGSLGLPNLQLASVSPMLFTLMAVISITGASMFIMWLGDQITARGIGNGISLIIMINITSRLPSAIVDVARRYFGMGGASVTGTPWELMMLVVLGAFVLMGTVALTQGLRKVPIHSTRQVSRGSAYGGGTTYFPLRVNYSGVMPIIFAGPILMIPAFLFRLAPVDTKWGYMLNNIADQLSSGASWLYMALYAILILFFCFFWVATQFNAINISDSLKRDGSYVPGIRPGMATAEYLDGVMTRVTFIGAIGLLIIAIMPILITQRDISRNIADFFGGTSLLIIVGVALDTLRQMESHLLMRNYDGFLKHGRLTGRR